MRVLIAALSMCAAGCGSDPLPPGDNWELGQRAEAPPQANYACDSDSQCAEDEYCHRPAACDAERYCEQGYPPISAAAPNLACGCDGTIEWVGHGYPGPHAWQVGNLAWSAVDGTRCDAGATPPFDYAIELHIPAPPDADGGRVLVRLSETLSTAMRVRELPNDGVLRYEATGDQWAQFAAAVLVDVDGDGECDPDTDIAFLASAPEPSVDLESFAVLGETELYDPGEDPCVFW